MIVRNDNNRTSVKPAFGNAAINSAMNYLATNQAIGASATDMAFMVIPRTVIDSTRTPEAGLETGRRELASCLLYAFMGFFGLAAGRTIETFSKIKKYNVPVHEINAGSHAIDALAHSWNNALDKHGRDFTNKKETVNTYLNEVFDSVSGLSGNTKTSLNSKPEIKKEIVEQLSNLLLNKEDYSIAKEKKFDLVKKIIHATGAGEHLTLSNSSNEIKLSANDLLDNTYSLGRTFMQDKVADEFKNTKNVADNKFIQSLKKFNFKKMALGLGLVSAVAISMQAANRLITKKKTGSDGFVVYKDKNGKGEKAKKDKSTEFKILKGIASAGMGWFALNQIGGKLKDIPKKLEFTKIMPNLNQYKYIYAVAIIGRFLASSDKNELRETATRDFLGFTSWLLLGDLAARSVARSFEKHHKDVQLLNWEDKTKTGFSKLMNSSMKTHEELLYAGTKKAALGQSIKQASELASDVTKKSLKYLNIAQLSGYAFSGLFLGVLIPMVNKVVTNKLHNKELEKKENLQIKA